MIHATNAATVRAAYHATVAHPQHTGPWVGMAALRDQSGLTRAAFDDALAQLFCADDVHLVLDADRATITDADRHAAVDHGSGPLHLMLIA